MHVLDRCLLPSFPIHPGDVAASEVEFLAPVGTTSAHAHCAIHAEYAASVIGHGVVRDIHGDGVLAVVLLEILFGLVDHVLFIHRRILPVVDISDVSYRIDKKSTPLRL